MFSQLTETSHIRMLFNWLRNTYVQFICDLFNVIFILNLMQIVNNLGLVLSRAQFLNNSVKTLNFLINNDSSKIHQDVKWIRFTFAKQRKTSVHGRVWDNVIINNNRIAWSCQTKEFNVHFEKTYIICNEWSKSCGTAKQWNIAKMKLYIHPLSMKMQNDLTINVLSK